MNAIGEAFRIVAEGVAPDGFQIADERESLLWGFVNCLDAQVRRLDRSVDRLSPELRDLQREQDGTEIKSRELELVTDRAQNLGDLRQERVVAQGSGEVRRVVALGVLHGVFRRRPRSGPCTLSSPRRSSGCGAPVPPG